MPKLETLHNSDEEDIWDYQPRHRARLSQTSKARSETNNSKKDSDNIPGGDAKKQTRKRKSTARQSQSEKQTTKDSVTESKKSDSHKNRTKKLKTNTRSQVKTPKGNDRGSVSKTDERRTGFCPVCQMPYAALSTVQSPTWHISECLDIPYSSKKECPAGANCDSTIPSHYKKFHHKQLARHRARLKSGEAVERSHTETKRKIEFKRGPEKENIPEDEVKSTDDVADSDSPRAVDQMLMDALDDTALSNDIACNDNPHSQTIQGNMDKTDTPDISSFGNLQSNFGIKSSKMAQGTKHQRNSAITISDSDISDGNETLKAQDRELKLSDNTDSDSVEPTISSCEPVDETDLIVDTSVKKENSTGPSFFELSQSAQKLGFFARKRRQRNHASTKIPEDEVPSKRKRKNEELVEKLDNKCQSEVKNNSLKSIKKEKSSADKNSNPSKSLCKVDLTSAYHSQQDLVERGSEGDLCHKEKHGIDEINNVIESGCDIKIEDIRSGASDIFFGNGDVTKVTDKLTTETCDNTQSCKADGVSCDSMSSRSDIFESDSEQCVSESESSLALEEINTDVKLQKHAFGAGFIIDDESSDLETTDSANTTLTESKARNEHEATVGSDLKSVEKPGKSSIVVGICTLHKAKSAEVTPTTESKPSTLRNAFSVLMQKGKSLCQSLSSKKAATQPGKNAMDILMNNKTKFVPRDTKPRRGWSSKDENNSEAGRDWNQGTTKNCPFYKKIPGTPFTVDAFRYGNVPDCKAYFLTHFHYDHYGGLTKKFSNPIYCSQITCNLVRMKIKTDNRYLNPVPLNTPVVVEGVEVTFLDANHCPGSVLILFRLKNGKVFLHTGDFRANSKMEVYPSLVDLHVQTLYLDTTYCDPQYTFPPQEDVISFAVKLVLDARTANPRTLVVCGSYTIGKERIFTAVAEALNCKICVNRDKKAVLDCLDDPELSARVSLRWEDSGLHVIPMGKLNYKGLEDHLKEQAGRFDCVLALEPTGWTCNKQFKSLAQLKPKLQKDKITLYGIPYSEHSSYNEMKRFCQFVRPDKILPTVNNGNAHSRRKMEVIFEEWNAELKQGKVKKFLTV